MNRVPDDVFAQIIRHSILVSIDLILRDGEGHILCGRRTNEPAKGLYFVPGGVIRKNERIEHAFRRIALAETGLDIPFTRACLLGVYEHFYSTNRYGDDSYGTHYIVLGYDVALTHRPHIHSDAQHSDIRWSAADDVLSALDVHENTKAYFR